MVTPTSAVTRFDFVITSDNFLLLSFSNLKSRFVTIPIRTFLLLTIGIPPILYSLIQFLASETNEFSFNVTGSNIIPDSDLLTFFTLSA